MIVGVLGYSRVMVGRMVPSREAHDILSGNLACLQAIDAVPKKGVYDNEGALVSRHGGKATLTDPFQRFRGTLGMQVIVLRPADPESKGVVERHNGYLETSFLPGRRFSDPADFNTQLEEWLVRANRRIHATLRCRPDRPLRGGQGGHDGVAAGAARHLAAHSPPASPGTTGCGSGPATTRSTPR